MISKGTYINSSETKILRVLDNVYTSNQVYVVEMDLSNHKIKTTYRYIDELRDYSEISEDEFIQLSCGTIPDWISYSRLERKLCIDRYGMISNIIEHVGDCMERFKMIVDSCDKYKITQQTLVNRCLNPYLFYGRIEALLPSFNRPAKAKSFKYDAKPKYIEKTYSSEDKAPGTALLTINKIFMKKDSARITCYVAMLTDTGSEKILAYATGEKNEGSLLLDLLDRCLSLNEGKLPMIIYAPFGKATYCSRFRNIQCIIHRCYFGPTNVGMIPNAKRAFSMIAAAHQKRSSEAVSEMAGKIVDECNKDVSRAVSETSRGAPVNCVIFKKDNVVRCSDEELHFLFNNQYILYFKDGCQNRTVRSYGYYFLTKR